MGEAGALLRPGVLFLLLLGAVVLVGGCRESVEIPPQPLSTASPFRYPIDQWDGRVEGEVLLMVRVGADGHADTAYVHETSGVPALDSAALVDVRGLLFAPARRDGERIDMWVRLPVRYRMGGGADPTDAVPPGDSLAAGRGGDR